MSDPNDIVVRGRGVRRPRAPSTRSARTGKTPYFSHPVRVCLVVRQVFGFDDPRMLAAALLHDTIEDTTTDCDDIDRAVRPGGGAVGRGAHQGHAVAARRARSRPTRSDWRPPTGR